MYECTKTKSNKRSQKRTVCTYNTYLKTLKLTYNTQQFLFQLRMLNNSFAQLVKIHILDIILGNPHISYIATTTVYYHLVQ